MIRKLLAIHRNLFLDAVNSNSVPFPITLINYEYGLIFGQKTTDIYPTLKDVIFKYTESNKMYDLTISYELRLIMLMLFTNGFMQMHLSKMSMGACLSVEPSGFSKLLHLNQMVYKSRPIF